MRPLALAWLLAGSTALAAPNLSGTWTFTARASDGTTVEQTASIRQITRAGKLYLQSEGRTVQLVNGSAALSQTQRDADATRTYRASVRFTGRTASGSGTVREVYKTGRVVLTRYVIRGRR